MLSRSGRHLRDVISMIHRRHEVSSRRDTGREKERDVRGGGGVGEQNRWGNVNDTPCRKGQLRIQRIDRIALPRSYGSPHCRDAGAKREKEPSGGWAFRVPPPWLHFPSARPMEEAARKRTKKRERERKRKGRKGRRREASATRRRRNKRRYVNEIK